MKKGFSLIEVVAAIAIFSIAILAISMAFSASLNISQMNDIKQDTSQYAQAITENYKALGYNEINIKYNDLLSNNGIMSGFQYFNTIDDIQTWFNNDNGQKMPDILSIADKIDNNSYPLAQGKKFGALISISKTNLSGSTNADVYRIYVRVWRLDKGAQSQSLREIYEGSD